MTSTSVSSDTTVLGQCPLTAFFITWYAIILSASSCVVATYCAPAPASIECGSGPVMTKCLPPGICMKRNYWP